MKIKDRPKAFLVGPFVGKLEWELYRFAPYIITLKKENPTGSFIVFTRLSRVDLYGKYAKIFVPLRIPKNDNYVEDGFGLQGLSKEGYEKLAMQFRARYAPDFNIIDHIYPRITSWKRRIKWQFPRDQMSYDFRPRDLNRKIVLTFLNRSPYSGRLVLFESDPGNEAIDYLGSLGISSILENSFDTFVYRNLIEDSGLTYIGCLIEMIRECKFVVGDLNSILVRLSLLLEVPVISFNQEITDDEIHLLNPFGVPFIRCSSIQEGVEIYESNI